MSNQIHDPEAAAETASQQPHPGLIGKADFPIHMFAGEQVGITNTLERTPTPMAHYAVGENGEFEALPMPDRRWITEEAPDFRADLEAAIAEADLAEHDTGRTAAEIAAELLKHPALAVYLEIGEIANTVMPDCEYQNESESMMAQFQRYAGPQEPSGLTGQEWDPAHYGVDLADGAADLGSEAEWLGNVAWAISGGDDAQLTKEAAAAQWNEHRRPQLMAIAKAGMDAIQELSGMQAELKGFHEDRPVEAGPALQHWQGNKLMLIVSEAVEAHDEIRSGRHAWETHYPTMPAGSDEDGKVHKPEGVPSEIADIIVRAADFAWTEGFDLSQIVLEKLDYNNTRAYRHGKKF